MTKDTKYRIYKKQSNYSIIPNSVSQGLNYNLEALGLYVYMFSLPPDWEFYKSHLKKVCNVGIKKLNKLLKVLSNHGLIEESQTRNENGQFVHITMHVNEGDSFIPLKINDMTPEGQICRTAKTVRTVKNTYIINKDKVNKEKETNTLQDENLILPEWLNPESWNEFKQHRKEMKEPLSKLAERKALKVISKLREEGHDPREIIDQTILNGWKGFFAPRKATNLTKNQYSPMDGVHLEGIQKLPYNKNLNATNDRSSANVTYAGMRDFTAERIEREKLNGSNKNS